LGVVATISDAGGTGKELNLVNSDVDPDGPTGIPTYTERRKDLNSIVIPFLNDLSGADMTVNVAFGGAPELIHNGSDTLGTWSGTVIQGTWVFNSTTQANTGSASIDATATVTDDEALFASGGLINFDNFTALTGAVYLTKFSSTGIKHIEIRTRLSGVNVGSVVNLDDFIDTGTLNAWQSFAIGDASFGLNGDNVDEFVVRTVSSGGGPPPAYFLDDMQWEQTGVPQVFTASPSVGTWLHLTSLSLFFADDIAGTLANGTMPNLAFDQLLGVSKLNNGVIVQLTQKDKVTFQNNFRQLADLLVSPTVSVQNAGSDGTNTWMKLLVDFPEPIILKSELGDSVTLTFNDDLSGLSFLRAAAAGEEEIRK